MTHQNPTDPDVLREMIEARLSEHWKWLMFTGVAVALLGVVGIALPLLMTLAVEIFVGWLFVIGGVLRILALFNAKHMPGFWWSLFGAALAVLLGLALIFMPWPGVLTLTMVMAAIFLAEGVSAIFSAFSLRLHSENWGWLLFSGGVDLVLAFLILQGWPQTAGWVLGLLTGVNLLVLGVSIAMVALAAHRRETQA